MEINHQEILNLLPHRYPFLLVDRILDYTVNKKITGKAILVSVNCANDCFTSCGGTTGEPAEPWEVRAVSLIR